MAPNEYTVRLAERVGITPTWFDTDETLREKVHFAMFNLPVGFTQKDTIQSLRRMGYVIIDPTHPVARVVNWISNFFGKSI